MKTIYCLTSYTYSHSSTLLCYTSTSHISHNISYPYLHRYIPGLSHILSFSSCFYCVVEEAIIACKTKMYQDSDYQILGCLVQQNNWVSPGKLGTIHRWWSILAAMPHTNLQASHLWWPVNVTNVKSKSNWHNKMHFIMRHWFTEWKCADAILLWSRAQQTQSRPLWPFCCF